VHDVIVVGTGAAGSVLAGRLSEDPARRVLALEAGRKPPEGSDMPAMWISLVNTEIDWGYHTVPQVGCKMRRIFWPRGKALGGSAAINAMIYMRGLPLDYDTWEAMGATGWGWRDVFPTFLKSEHNAGWRTTPSTGRAGRCTSPTSPMWTRPSACGSPPPRPPGLPRNEDFNGATQEGAGFFQLFVKDGERFGAAKAYLVPALGRPNLEVRTGVHTTRVADREGPRRRRGIPARGAGGACHGGRGGAVLRRHRVLPVADAVGRRAGGPPARGRGGRGA
jgi:choline dehydrogenase